MQSLVDKQEQYITLLQSLTTRMEATASLYARLEKDPGVQAALAKLNQQSAIPLRLGPSTQFASALETFRRERKAVDTAVIKLEMQGGVPHVNVTLNGKLSLKMVLDSGASVVTLPAFIANQLGINPGKNAPAITLTTANGAKVEARIARLQSIRLGQFVAQDVECAVLPSSVPDAGCLLGSSFLRHFTYRMDLMAGQLHMSQIEEVEEDKDASNDAHDQTAPATPPGLSHPPDTKMPVLPGGWVMLVTKDGFALDISGGSKHRGGPAIAYKRHGGLNQQWRFDLAEDNTIRIRNNKSSLLIGIREGKKDAGTDVIQWSMTNEPTQLWSIEPVSDGYVRIVNKGSGLCLSVRGGRKQGSIVQEPWTNQDTQLWRIVPLALP
jgi:clan AA aspartic protease (TIGR02281 family)